MDAHTHKANTIYISTSLKWGYNYCTLYTGSFITMHIEQIERSLDNQYCYVLIVFFSQLDQLKTLEEEQDQLNTSLLALTTHFAQVQFRLKQIVSADTDSKEVLYFK